MGENLCQLYVWQRFHIKNMQRTQNLKSQQHQTDQNNQTESKWPIKKKWAWDLNREFAKEKKMAQNYLYLYLSVSI